MVFGAERPLLIFFALPMTAFENKDGRHSIDARNPAVDFTGAATRTHRTDASLE